MIGFLLFVSICAHNPYMLGSFNYLKWAILSILAVYMTVRE